MKSTALARKIARPNPIETLSQAASPAATSAPQPQSRIERSPAIASWAPPSQASTSVGRSSVAKAPSTANAAPGRQLPQVILRDVPGPNSTKYNLKREFWAFLVSAVAKNTTSVPIPMPENETLKLTRYVDKDPRIGIRNILVPDRNPKAEDNVKQKVAFKILAWLSKHIPLSEPGQPPISADTTARNEELFGPRYRALPGLPIPHIPAEIQANPSDAIGAVALQAPFGSYLSKVDPADPTDQRYQIDLTAYEALPVQDGLLGLGGLVDLEFDPKAGKMKTTAITRGGRRIPADHPDHAKAQQIIGATFSTDVTAGRHLAKCHLITGGLFAAVTTNTLDKDEPLRRLLHPHFHLTLSTNNDKVHLLLEGKGATVPTIFSYDPPEVFKLMDATAASFDLSRMDPRTETKARGMLDSEGKPFVGSFPYLDNYNQIAEITDRYVSDFIDAYYPTDASLSTNDTPDRGAKRWMLELDRRIPNGLGSLIGAQERLHAGNVGQYLTKDNVKKLVSLLINVASLEHEIVGNASYHYLSDPVHFPSEVPASGELPSVDVQQRVTNTFVATFLPLNKLMDPELRKFAPDDRGIAVMDRYLADLGALQARMEKDPATNADHIYRPDQIEISVSS